MKKCRTCRLPVDRWPIQPRNRLAKVCSIECASVLARVEGEKQARRQLRVRKEALKTHPQLVKEAQRAFNRYRREATKHMGCVSCGKPYRENDGITGQAFDCGHWRSTGSAPHLRFTENNAWAQCVHCNKHLSGNVIPYRVELIKRIGLEAVEELENDNAVRRYTKDELREIKAEYNRKYNELKKQRGQ